MQYDTIMGMLFYEVSKCIRNIFTILEERKEEEGKGKEQKMDLILHDYTPDKMMRNAQNYMSF